MRMYDLILKKRQGKPLTKDEIQWMIREYTDGRIPDYQMSALLMAICLRLLLPLASSSALKICSALENDKILFIPDPNLGSYVAKQLPEKQFAFYHGGCPRHIVCSAADVAKARAAHPEALLLVHPECRPEVVEQADYVGSTTGIMAYAEKSDAKEFIIGTENSIVEHLSYACPEKRFYPLAVQLTCMNMKLTTLMDIYHCLQGSGGEEITLPQDVMQGAGRCIRRMVALGG